MRSRFLGSLLALLSWLTVSPSGAFGLEIEEGPVDVAAEAGQTRLLFWNDGRMSVRTLPPSGGPIHTPEEGPFGDWTATSISDGPDGRSRVLWVNGDGRAGLEIVGPSGSEAAFQYPAIPAWSAADVAATRDGGASLLWTSASGAMRLATVDGNEPPPWDRSTGPTLAGSLSRSPRECSARRGSSGDPRTAESASRGIALESWMGLFASTRTPIGSPKTSRWAPTAGRACSG